MSLDSKDHTTSWDHHPAISSGASGAPEDPTSPDAVPEHMSLEHTLASIEGYRILGEIHRGGQGVVFRAVQLATNRIVALKVLNEGEGSSTDKRLRFEREVNLAAALKHPSIVTIYDSGITKNRFYFAMEYVEGASLDEYVEYHQLGIGQILSLMQKISEAVGYAHQHGVVHRDLKPDNIRIDEQGEPHILDLGLAKTVGSAVIDQKSITMDQAFVGTLAFAAPEQIPGCEYAVDSRTDVYALGVILYRLLTGYHPYGLHGSLFDVNNRIAETVPRRPSYYRKELHRDVDTIVLTCLSKHPPRRYANAGDLARDLQRHLEGGVIEARRDQLGYVMYTHLKQGVRRYGLASLILVFLLTVGLSEATGQLLNRYRAVDHAVESWITTYAASQLPTVSFDQIRVVALSDKTPIDALVDQEKLEGVSADHAISLRKLHGRFMQKLAASGVRVLVWDISFTSRSPYDEDFMQGVGALHAADAEVVTGTKFWWSDTPESPPISDVIASGTRWGCILSAFGGGEEWRITVAMQRSAQPPLPSLSLAAVMAYRHPRAEPVIELESSKVNAILINYFDRDRGIWVKDTDRLVLTSLGRPLSGQRFGESDRVGELIIRIPNDEQLETWTTDYGEIFAMSPVELRERFADRIAIVGDVRGQTDRHAHPDGRRIPGCYGHAAGIVSLLSDLSLDRGGIRWNWWPSMVVSSVSAFIGVLVGLCFARVPALRGIVLCTLLFVCVGMVVWAARHSAIWNPIVSLFALMVSCELAAFVGRIRFAGKLILKGG